MDVFGKALALFLLWLLVAAALGAIIGRLLRGPGE